MAKTRRLVLAIAPSLGLVLSLGVSPDPGASAERRDLTREPAKVTERSEGTERRSLRR